MSACNGFSAMSCAYLPPCAVAAGELAWSGSNASWWSVPELQPPLGPFYYAFRDNESPQVSSQHHTACWRCLASHVPHSCIWGFRFPASKAGCNRISSTSHSARLRVMFSCCLQARAFFYDLPSSAENIAPLLMRPPPPQRAPSLTCRIARTWGCEVFSTGRRRLLKHSTVPINSICSIPPFPRILVLKYTIHALHPCCSTATGQ